MTTPHGYTGETFTARPGIAAYADDAIRAIVAAAGNACIDADAESIASLNACEAGHILLRFVETVGPLLFTPPPPPRAAVEWRPPREGEQYLRSADGDFLVAGRDEHSPRWVIVHD